VSVLTAAELAEFHRIAQRRVHSLTDALNLATSAAQRVNDANLRDPLLAGLQDLYVSALVAAHEGALTGEKLAADRARDAWVAESTARQIAEANRADIAAARKSGRLMPEDVTQATP